MPTLESSMPEMEASGRSSTRKAARLAVYEATMIIANPAHTIPSTRALKLLGVPVMYITSQLMIIDLEVVYIILNNN